MVCPQLCLYQLETDAYIGLWAAFSEGRIKPIGKVMQVSYSPEDTAKSPKISSVSRRLSAILKKKTYLSLIKGRINY
ncbi:hypothetical protein KIN20_012473 [Parelaphostrongylus tenuis]|nr:hypothetical protein KIN20_012473 [Parelaphostrongylus tenuis]